MKKRFVFAVAAVTALLAAGCVMPPAPPDPGPELCPPGFFSATGEAPCTPAPLGTFVDSEGATEATDCPPGFYQDEEGQVSCKAALPGTFVDVSGATSANLCPLGRFQPNAAATECLLAPVGAYVDVEGAVASTPAAPGFFVDEKGAAQASPCPLGRYQPLSAQSSCLIAEVGTYVDQLAAAQTTPCPAGTTTLAAGATSPSDCVPVEPFVCEVGLGSVDYDPGILLADPNGPVAQQTEVQLGLSNCSSSEWGEFQGLYTGTGLTVPLYINDAIDNSFLTLPIGTAVSRDTGIMGYTEPSTGSVVESDLVLISDPVDGSRAYELRWNITAGKFSGTSAVATVEVEDVLDGPTLTYTGAQLTLGTVSFN